jgi:hypothetical protein
VGRRIRGEQRLAASLAEPDGRGAGGRRLLAKPWEWDRHAFVLGGLLGLPLLCLPLVGTAVHFIDEARFNRSLLFELVARPATARSALASVAEVA